VELVPGAALGPYLVVERAGVGGMAEVWKAYQPGLDRFVAIKVLPRHLASQPGFVERFRREALAVSRLDHPNILAVHDFGEQDGFTYMVTPFVAGGTLAQHLGRPWAIAEVQRFLDPLAAALDYAHQAGIVHRDVKPSNVLISDQGRVLLSDFGVARVLESSPALTAAGTLVGTPAYMAPEQVEGRGAGPACDLYSLGIILYEALTGRVPFQADTPLAVALAHIQRPIPLPRSVNPAITEATQAVLLKALAKSPTDRYASATALIVAVAASASSLSIATQRVVVAVDPPLPEAASPTMKAPLADASLAERRVRGALQSAPLSGPAASSSHRPLAIAALLGLVVLAGALVLLNRPIVVDQPTTPVSSLRPLAAPVLTSSPAVSPVGPSPVPAAPASGFPSSPLAASPSPSPATVSRPAATALPAAGPGSPTPTAMILLSDAFERANADRCALGAADLALGGRGSHFYLPIFGGANAIGANIESAYLRNNGQDFGGLQVTASPNACTSPTLRGENLGQDLNIRLDLLVPTDAARHLSQAGPYFRSRAAAAGDGIIGGAPNDPSGGYWVQLVSNGEVRVKNLRANSVVATAGLPASFDANVPHTLEVAASGAGLQVALDRSLLSFTQGRNRLTTVAIPATAQPGDGTSGNQGTVGIAFGAEENRGQIGGQRADNLRIAAYSPLANR
jgi:serine/threonine protein kinase